MDLAELKRRLQEHQARRGRQGRRLLAVVILLAALAVIIRVILDPLATHFTRRELDQLSGYRGELERVHVTIFPPGYAVTHLKLWQDPSGSPRAPMFYADRVDVALDWRKLLHRRLAASVRVEDAKVIVARRETGGAERPPAAAPDLTEQLERIVALKVDRVEVLRSEVLFRDLAEPARPELWFHAIDAAVENLPTRPALAQGRPTTVSAHGALGRSGEVTLFVSADPFARPLSFAGRFALRGFQAAELYDLIAPKTKLEAARGTINVFAEFVSRAGEITGGIKPVLENVSVAPAEPDAGLWKRLEAWAADKTVHLFSDRVPERNAVATVIPIEGRLTDPDIQLWPTVFGVIRNAFVEGLSAGFAHLPPQTAPEKESVLKQAKRALQKDKGPPQAQPQGRRQPGASR